MSLNTTVSRFCKSGDLHAPKYDVLQGAVPITVGSKWGMLTVISTGAVKCGRSAYLCRCDCGVEKVYRATELRDPRSKSCGCLCAIVNRRIHTRHGAVGTGEYNAYRGALSRCQNPRHRAFKNYGGRGIEFRFASFEAFLAELGPRPDRTYSLDRIDNDGHYEAGNVRRATMAQQVRNRRRTHRLTINGITQSVADWSEQIGISEHVLKERHWANWCDVCILKPVRRGQKGCEHRDSRRFHSLEKEQRRVAAGWIDAGCDPVLSI